MFFLVSLSTLCHAWLNRIFSWSEGCSDHDRNVVGCISWKNLRIQKGSMGNAITVYFVIENRNHACFCPFTKHVVSFHIELVLPVYSTVVITSHSRAYHSPLQLSHPGCSLGLLRG